MRWYGRWPGIGGQPYRGHIRVMGNLQTILGTITDTSTSVDTSSTTLDTEQNLGTDKHSSKT